eukprot:TRINITY_DN8640_c0_g2_i1.p1 TRINITY_DN8640_c0_g2~~TRINITY_DN8640_c0_g2_i1.p1  ORF type:complete len:349 (+),score=58.49 TRINITY_DN8640_c0_g2_i1:33-1049(+)
MTTRKVPKIFQSDEIASVDLDSLGQKAKFDSPEELSKKVDTIIKWMHESKYSLAFTGAGISKSAGIPDYRSEDGIWTKAARGEKMDDMKGLIAKARPSFGHRALKQLLDEDHFKFIISTNLDGLHLKSGVPDKLLAEVHGNIFKEYCKSCEAEYLRKFNVMQNAKQRMTGRLCEKCSSPLSDTVINFGEYIRSDISSKAASHSKQAQFGLVIGSSLTVGTLNYHIKNIPRNGGKFAIINLQETPLDSKCDLKVWAKSDDFLKLLADKMDVTVPEDQYDAEEEARQIKDQLSDLARFKDPNFDKISPYYGSSMADDGPPPPAVLRDILHFSKIKLKKVS